MNSNQHTVNRPSLRSGLVALAVLGAVLAACSANGEGDLGGENAPALVYPFAVEHAITQSPADHKYTDHENWDVDCYDGEELRAPVSGLVVKAVHSATGYGNSIGIEVPGWGTMHLNHLHSIDVAEGCWVEASEVIGKCGKTGNVTPLGGGDGSHLDVYAVSLGGQNINLPSPALWPMGPDLGPAKCGEGGGSCGCEGSLDVAEVDGDQLVVAGSLHCDSGIDKWSVVVHETTVHSGYPNGDSVDFYETIDLGKFGLEDGSNAVGLWARPSDADACLLDDAGVILMGGDTGDTGDTGDGCVVDRTTCYLGDVYEWDSCGDLGDLVDSCDGAAVCVQVSPTTAACEVPPDTCNGVELDPGEACDGLALGGATCQSEGFDHGTIACTGVCTLDTSACCHADVAYQCQGGDVYYRDSCGDFGGLKQACGNGEICVNTSQTTAECSKTCGNGELDPGEDCDGGDLGGATCLSLGYSGGSLSCTNSCAYNEGACESCGASTYWTPTPTSQTDNVGQQSNATILEPITMEVREDGPGIEFRVCKQNGAFMNDVKVSIRDSNGGAQKLVDELATQGKACSSWTPLSNDNGYSEGEKFVGEWSLVSPSYIADSWPQWASCAVNGDPGGTCWNGSGLSMTRTCKE
ncbi:MAG: M23 family metallopeptidase [Myxococcales bacterium]|nr:M23 family metallopeptidase [Myxococcales bacterium]